jgi:CheY-like chemotaxis protein
MARLDENFLLVLVVEDEALVRGCAAALLEDAGCGVIEAADAEEALRAFEAHSSQVTTVFTDINMPGAFNGLSLARKIFELRPQVQLILTSGRSPPQDEMPAGGLFLPKPYDAGQLTALIRAA